LPFVFSGTLIVHGQGRAEVTATGPLSEIGKIGTALGGIDSAPPPLRAQTKRFVRGFAVVGALLAACVVVLYALTRHDWIGGFLAGIAISMSMLPEEIPLVLTVFMVMGSWRISRARVLTRRAAAIETLGATTVLCTDKTGTLTQNRMSVAELRMGELVYHLDGGADAAVPAPLRKLIDLGVLASAPDPFDPMEKAFHALASTDGDWTLEHGFGLSSELLAVTQIWKAPDRPGYIVAAKGAPEAVARLCGLTPDETAAMRGSVDEMATKGMRVLALAEGEHEGCFRHPLSTSPCALPALSASPIPCGPRRAMPCANAGPRVFALR